MDRHETENNYDYSNPALCLYLVTMESKHEAPLSLRRVKTKQDPCKSSETFKNDESI